MQTKSWPPRVHAALALFMAALLVAPVQATAYGCFSSLPSEFKKGGSDIWMSSGACSTLCSGYTVFATQNYDCYCANVVPNNADKSDQCTINCPGFPSEKCGGNNAYNVYVVGSYSTASASGVSSSTSSTSSGSQSGSSTTSSSPASTASSSSEQAGTSSSGASSATGSSSAAGSTATKSTSSTSSGAASTASSSGSANTNSGTKAKNASGGISGGAIAGIVVGVVVGVAAIAALAFFLWRRRRDQDDDDGYYSPGASPNKTFGSIPPVASSEKNDFNNSYPVVDQRLNPEILSHRISFASLTDARDYSRQILHVTNPDK